MNPFFERPIVNSPYEYPRQHWELDEAGQPTGRLLDRRRRAEFITPIPKPKKRRGSTRQQELGLDERVMRNQRSTNCSKMDGRLTRR
jgi:type III restriction enzyme